MPHVSFLAHWLVFRARVVFSSSDFESKLLASRNLRNKVAYPEQDLLLIGWWFQHLLLAYYHIITQIFYTSLCHSYSIFDRVCGQESPSIGNSKQISLSRHNQREMVSDFFFFKPKRFQISFLAKKNLSVPFDGII